jgi:predicted lysophospholipase L1 biosynthesis ABC-type transport system permease subunit
VVIVDEMASTLLFPDRDPLNANLQLHGTGAQLQVVGIVASVRARGPAVDPAPHIYLPIADGAASGLLVRSAGAAHKVDTELRSLLTTIARDSSTTPTLYSIDDAYAQITTERRSSAWLLSTLCLVSLLVGLTGVYTAVSTMVTAQTEALRVRAAIGASRLALGAYVLRSAGKLILIGLVVGLPAGAIATGALSAVLFRTSANDAMIYVIAALVTSVVGFAASAGPALRTARTDPAGILRN